MRSGFLARAGLALGPLAVSFGYGAGPESVATRAALLLLADNAMTEVVTTIEVTEETENDDPFAIVAISDDALADVRTSHEAWTVLELEEDT